MKKLLTILTAVMLVTLMCIGSAQAWVLGTTDSFTLTYDGSTNISMPATNFNFSLDPDWHMWDPSWTGPKNAYTYLDTAGLYGPAGKLWKPHKFQSSLNAFFLTINSAGGVSAYDRGDTPNTTVLTSTNQYWAITLDSLLNTHIRGLSAQGLSANGGTVSGTLVSDGILHWYGNYPDVLMSGSENYNDKFNFLFTGIDNHDGTYTGTMTLYATPIPGSVLLLGSGLVGLASLRLWRRRAVV